MRSLLNLFVMSALSVGCTSGLWGPFAEDTTWNCNVTPCTEGATCNQATGYCEGGPDLSPPAPDMQLPIFVKEETVLKLSGRSLYHLAIGDLAGNGDPEIFLSGDYTGGVQDAVLLEKTSNYGSPQLFTQVPGSQFITSVVPYRYTGNNQPLDVVAVSMNINSPMDTNGAILHFYKDNTTPDRRVTPLNNLRGYKSVAVGYVQPDLLPDLVITSSLAPIVTMVYPGNGATGAAEIFTGVPFAVPRMPFNGPGSVAGGGFSFVTLIPRPEMSTWANTTFFTGVATKPASNSVELVRDGNGSIFQSIPTGKPTDLAFLADMDGSGSNDLVLLNIAPIQGASTLRVSFNAGSNTSPSYPGPVVTLSDGDGIVAGATGVNLLDFDNDGFIDLTVSAYFKKSMLFLANRRDERTGGRSFVPVRILIGTLGARSVAHDDMDLNGCRDVVALFGGEAADPGTEVMILSGRCP